MESVNSQREGHRARLRERFANSGLGGFAEYEVIELLLTLCIPRRDVKPLAKRLLARFGSLKGVLDAPLPALREVEGVGEVTPVALRIVKETMAYYLRQQTEAQPVFDNLDALLDLWRTRLGELREEVFEVAYFDQSYRMIRCGIERMEEGSPNRTTVYPRKVAAHALQRSAVHVVIAHNHPGGQLEASQQDIHLTKQIQSACKAVGVNLLDHIIVTENDAFSFLEQGLL